MYSCIWCGDNTSNPFGFCSEECYESHGVAMSDPTLTDADVVADNTQNGKIDR